MPSLIDWTGKIFGEWTVLERDQSKGCPVHWFCKCSCGTIRSIPRSNLSSQKTTNCGCIQRLKISIRMSTHGQSKSKLYGVWMAMRRRCYLPTTKDYEHWGGRGITVCDDWKSDYTKFYEWSLNNGYQQGLTIERKDNDLGYSPSNCKWATRTEQCRNRSISTKITINGVTRVLSEWSELSGLDRQTIQSRIKYGWPER